ncbi:3-deoxy-manno-octulosonate cytidylyltransferase [Alteromonas lipolytica]|uniref:3-deoxy-manno-octulosonate cytidylyltransferase n=1 Tax=Alteromonas lipolytica TaxID=1856405 RepID=A0A1E8FGI3_9ALTE|nr:3-deoxy-manno-octulosonate cytidylyltransferase [Alteromonas lipolytica]OFI35067.1 3-deoxy-manno-octulosonate cytidylyltransferase [Alteromonas lipolytica]GGF56375.1 3-deoxy-manno-octulosonate cytidylyltransferase [Alteromonas lipolytica]
MDFTVIIPARYQSSRFPGKPLADIQGKPMIQHVVERATEAGANKIIVATDDERIATVAEAFAQVVMTSTEHTSGTERLAEVIAREQIADDTVIVNVQGDEPFVPADNIRQVALNLRANPSMQMATLCTAISDEEEVFNPNIVKVVFSTTGKALYFSRSVLPFARDTMMSTPVSADPSLYFRHIGLYAYTAKYINQYVSYAPSALEQIESLEQLRALWYDDAIHIEEAIAPPPVGIDTPEDLAHLLNVLAARA